MQIRKKTKYSLSLITGTLIASLTVALLFVSIADIRSISTPKIAVESIAAESLETQPQPPATIDEAPSVQEPPSVVEDTQESQAEEMETYADSDVKSGQIKGYLILALIVSVVVLLTGIYFLASFIWHRENTDSDSVYDSDNLEEYGPEELESDDSEGYEESDIEHDDDLPEDVEEIEEDDDFIFEYYEDEEEPA